MHSWAADDQLGRAHVVGRAAVCHGEPPGQVRLLLGRRRDRQFVAQPEAHLVKPLARPARPPTALVSPPARSRCPASPAGRRRSAARAMTPSDGPNCTSLARSGTLGLLGPSAGGRGAGGATVLGVWTVAGSTSGVAGAGDAAAGAAGVTGAATRAAIRAATSPTASPSAGSLAGSCCVGGSASGGGAAGSAARGSDGAATRSAVSAPAISAPADAGRSPGSFAMPRATRASRASRQLGYALARLRRRLRHVRVGDHHRVVVHERLLARQGVDQQAGERVHVARRSELLPAHALRRLVVEMCVLADDVAPARLAGHGEQPEQIELRLLAVHQHAVRAEGPVDEAGRMRRVQGVRDRP